MDLDDNVLNAAMEEFEEDQLVNDAYDDYLDQVYRRFQRERTWQRQLIGQSGGLVDPNQPGRFEFNLQRESQDVSRKFGIDQSRYRATMRQTGNFIDRPQLSSAIRDGLIRSLDHVLARQDLTDVHRLYFNIFSDRFSKGHYRGTGLTVGDWRQNTEAVNAALNHLGDALNSNKSFEMDDTFRVEVVTIRPRERGRGMRRRFKPGHKKKEAFKLIKQSIVRIKNRDELCGARAIVTAKAKLENHPRERTIRDGGRTQTVLAYALHRQAGVPEGPVGYDELKKFQSVLPDYRLMVIYAGRNYQCVVFSESGPNKKDLVILHDEDHYDAVTSVTGFYGTSYFCAHCLKSFDHLGEHRCELMEKVCVACQQTGCQGFLNAWPHHIKPTVACQKCRRFYDETCKENHEKFTCDRYPVSAKTLPVCLTLRRCKECFTQLKGFNNIKRHKCGYGFCPSCDDYVELKTHKCFIQPPKKRKRKRGKKQNKRPRLDSDCMEDVAEEEDDEEKPPLHIFFDIEAMQVQGIHEPNLVVCQTDESDNYYRYTGENCISEFLEFCEECTEGDERQVNVIAHNMQAYDGYFVLKQYYKNGQNVTQIRNGAKLMELVMDNVRFIDSLNFFQMPLSSFPKTFGLTELKKGFFPHLFNLPENQHYVGPVPAKDYFMTESMSLDKKKEFDEWYQKQQDDQVVFDCAKELVEYCDSDVQLLREGCLVFQKLFMNYAGFNPFDKVTLASACNHDLRKNCMIKDTIASEPVHGWAGKLGNQSKVALEWLSWLNDEKRKQASENMTEEERQSHDLMELAYPGYQHPCHMEYIKHAGNGGEFTDPRMKGSVDGYEEQSNVIYQFHGCVYHGCPHCYRNRSERHSRLENRTMYDAYDKTKQTTAKLKSYGYTVVEIWECMWTRMKANNKECADYVEGLNFVDRLNPCDAFFGGRTNAVKLHHQVSDSEKIHYIDFTSLYPFMNKMARYPLKHPKIITNPGTTDISN